MDFSIAIPVFNAQDHLVESLYSGLNQIVDGFNYEMVVVDDCSTDNTWDILQRQQKKFPELLKIFKLNNNSGPGIARNLAINKSCGDWILFLDSDDFLTEDALYRLHRFVGEKGNEYDAIAYDWRYGKSPISLANNGGRKDFSNVKKNKQDLLKDYVSLKMDGSVIFTLVRRSILNENSIMFEKGYHEDVDYIFEVYLRARAVAPFEQPLYIKNNRPGSIVNTISEQHVKGFFRAFRHIYDLCFADPLLFNLLEMHWHIGLVGVLATRIREAFSKDISEKQAAAVYEILFYEWKELLTYTGIRQVRKISTKYGLIAEKFLQIMGDKNLSLSSKQELIDDFMNEIMTKTWSCHDLHNSAFLAPNQIRTCCKRFFVDGQMKGDVVLIDYGDDNNNEFSSEGILKAKQNLYRRINSGDAPECDGCPFLEFKQWKPLDKLHIEYLSFEYHSICNMRCVYCCSTYYGGKRNQYDIIALINDMVTHGALDNCGSIVWGGGEPVLDANFNDLIDIISSKFPNAQQRVLTNCIKFSPKLDELLSTGQIMITTSVDAGTFETFYKVRRNKNFLDALETMSKYAAQNANRVTIKYIFIEELNNSIEEIKAFVKLIEKYDLKWCNFQISYDFKNETINDDSIISMIVLYGLLVRLGCCIVFFDDLLRQRFGRMSVDLEQLIKKKLAELGLSDILADREQYDNVVIWGAGWQAKMLIENSLFFNSVAINYMVDDSESNKLRTEFMGYEICKPEELLTSDLPVLISAVQGYPIIYESFKRLEINESRLIKGLII